MTQDMTQDLGHQSRDRPNMKALGNVGDPEALLQNQEATGTEIHNFLYIHL